MTALYFPPIREMVASTGQVYALHCSVMFYLLHFGWKNTGWAFFIGLKFHVAPYLPFGKYIPKKCILVYLSVSDIIIL